MLMKKKATTFLRVEETRDKTLFMKPDDTTK